VDEISVAIIGKLLILASFAGSALLAWAVVLMGRVGRRDSATAAPVSVSLVKPLHGAEPGLKENLASFLRQYWRAEVQMVCGVKRAGDPAAAIVAELRAAHPELSIDLATAAPDLGANAKISNLANIAKLARHDILIQSDSDIAVTPDYLARIVGALTRPGVGAVTCLYRGQGGDSLWSRLVALGIDLHFLPSALIGLASGLGHPCMGSTIALRRGTLARIGGFEAFADVLADDHAIGAAVRKLGLTVAVPDLLVTHHCAERSFAELWRHEQRWNATIIGIDPGGYAGSVILHPLPLAVIAGTVAGFSVLTCSAVALAIAARIGLALRLGHRSIATLMLVPLRDLVSFALFVTSWFARSVDWRGAQLSLESRGRVSAEVEKSQ